MYRTDDPIADFMRHDEEETRRLNRLPRCAYCHEPIQDEYLFDIDDELICEECLMREHKRPTEIYED